MNAQSFVTDVAGPWKFLLYTTVCGFQEPITSVPDEFTHSTAIGPLKPVTSCGT